MMDVIGYTCMIVGMIFWFGVSISLLSQRYAASSSGKLL